MTNEKKTRDYTRAAIDRYNAKFDRVAANLPKGTKDRIAAVAPGITPGAFVRDAAIKELERLEKEAAAGDPGSSKTE